MRHINYLFMHHFQADNKINLPVLIFQYLIKIVRGSIKIIPYGMYLSYLIQKVGCNVEIDHLVQQSKYHLISMPLGICNTLWMPKVTI